MRTRKLERLILLSQYIDKYKEVIISNVSLILKVKIRKYKFTSTCSYLIYEEVNSNIPMTSLLYEGLVLYKLMMIEVS